MKNLAFVLVLMAMVGACGRSGGIDSDNDGLSDDQEALFGTAWDDPDSDGDGLLDGEDPDPVPHPPILKVTSSPIYKDDDGFRCVNLVIVALAGTGKPIPGALVDVSWELGDIDPVVVNDEGLGEAHLCVDDDDTETVVVELAFDVEDDRFGATERTLTLSLLDLAVAGLNTSPNESTGTIDGVLTVYALDTSGVVGSARPFKGATVVVKVGELYLPAQVTGEKGSVVFKEDGLKGPVDVTVGAAGHRFTTYMGISAASVAILVDRLDPIIGVDNDKVGAIRGEVKGWLGEGGLAKWPSGTLVDQLGNPDGALPVAIVQIAIKGRPLSSMSMGSVLEAPSEYGSIPGLPVPGNMAICSLVDAEDPSASCTAAFELRNIPDGQHLLFAIGGVARRVLDAVKNPYDLIFEPIGLGIERVQVIGGEVVNQDIMMNIDMRPLPGTTVDINMGNLPTDWMTGEPYANGLVMPVMETGGEGFIFVAVDGSFNRDGFSNPVKVRFPEDDHPAIKDLQLDLTRLAVGLTGRATWYGADPPGISTPVRPGVQTGDVIRFDTADAWLDVPKFITPQHPMGPISPDALSEDMFTGEIVWEPVIWPRTPDLHVIRINYMTGAPSNPLADANDKSPDYPTKGTLGGPKSHCLWEIFVPGDVTSVTLPDLPETALARPVLKNPAPTTEDEDTPNYFGPDTIEVEINAYVLGADGKPFVYESDFAYEDVNMHCTVVSQDSVNVETP